MTKQPKLKPVKKGYRNPPIRKGSKNGMWKGRSASYESIHQWLKSNYGKPRKCSKCGIENLVAKNGKNCIEWALKHGKKYSHNVNNYKILCRKCHARYDIPKVFCTLEGCKRKHFGLGMCQNHYMNEYYKRTHTPIKPKKKWKIDQQEKHQLPFGPY